MKPTIPSLLLALCLSLTSISAEAQINATWTGSATPPNNTDYTDTLNWTGDQVPTGTATVSTTATIDLPNTATSLSGDLVVTGSVVINATTAGFTAATLQVNSSGTLTLAIANGGTVSFGEPAISSFIGGVHGTSGVLNLTGPGTLDFLAGTAPNTDDSPAIGVGGVGTVNQTNGTFEANNGLFIGGDAGTVVPSQGGTPGTGIYNISGASSTLTANFLAIGVGSTIGSTGTTTGLLNINGGLVSAGNVVLGYNDINTGGTVTRTSGSIQQTAGTFTVTTTIDIGNNDGSQASYAIGGGTFTAVTMNVGELAGSSGTFSQSGGSATVTNLNVGEAGNGAGNLFAGQLTVNTTGSLSVATDANATGTMTQTNGTLTLNGTAGLSVGGAGNGTYNQQGGLVTNTNTGSIKIGNGTGNGTYFLSSGTLTSNGTFIVGGGTGTGTFNYGGGTLNYTAGLEIGSNGVFNQNTNFTPTTVHPQMTLDAGSVYNLNSGTLTIGGNMGTLNASGIFGATGAIFNFAGGSVAPTGTDWTDGLNGSVTGNSTIDTTANNAILNGNLSGSGMITIIGNNTVDLNLTIGNSSAGAFGFHVMSGSLFANAATFPSVGSITVDSGATVNMAEHGTNALSGQISGAGAFQVAFDTNADLLALTGQVDLTGVTTLSGNGTLQVTDGTFSDLTGAGSLIVANNGMVNLTGATNNYTGSTTINPGGTLYASSIGNGGGTGILTNNGTLGSNATISTTVGANTLMINGSYAASTGTVLIRMASVAPNVVNTDVITINGPANVAGTTFTLLNPVATTGTFTDVFNSTALTGAGAIIQPTSNLFVHASFVPDTGNANNLDLITSTNTSAGIPGLSLTPNQAAAAATIDSLITNTANLAPGQLTNLSALLNLIGANGTSTSQLARNYEQLTPESLQYAQSIAYEHSAFLVSKVDSFDDALHHEFSGFDTGGVTITLPGFNSGLGREMQSMLAYDPSSWHSTAPNGVNYYPDDSGGGSTGATITPASPEPGEVMSDSPTTAPMPVRVEPHSVVLRKPYSNFSAFIGGDGTIADLNQDQGASYAPSSKASYTSVDAIAGVSYRMTNNLAAGVLMDYSHTDATTDSYGSKTKVDTYSPGVFATYADKGFYLNGLFSYGRNNYSNNRDVPVVGGIANSSPDGNQYTAALDAGYQLNLGQGLTITPSGGLTYTHLDIDSFTENGAAPADLSVDAQHDDSLRSRLGASVQYLTGIGQITLIPTLTAMWQHEFLDENAPITSSFNDLSSGDFTIHSVSMGRDSALIGVGLTAQLNNSMAIFFECNADVNENYNAENLVGGFKGSF